MKRRSFIFSLCIALFLVAAISLNTLAAPIKVFLEGKPLSFSTPPIVEQGTTLVPFRAIFEKLGLSVGWEQSTQTVTGQKDGLEIQLRIGSKTAYVNGKEKSLPVAPKVVQGSTLVPLRFVSEASGRNVAWDQATETIHIGGKPSIEQPKPPVPSTAKLKVHFIDVGQGDSILIQLPSGQTALIDGGSASAAGTVISHLKAAGVSKIDHLIATHPHEDHIGGLINVIQEFAVGKVYMPRVVHTSKTYENILLTIKAKGLKVTPAKAGLTLDCGPEVKLTFVAPNSESYENVNSYSAVLKLSYGSASFLFTGDAEALSEQEILAAKTDVTADVLKVGHHGSNTSTSGPFLEAVSPDIAVISVGEGNSYGHPSQQVIAALTKAKAEIYRTDLHGTIVVVSNGQEITVATDKKASPEKERAPGITPALITEPSKEQEYVGNKNSKKFHLPSCKSLPTPQNRVYFKLREEAIKAGYEPCKVCKP